MPERRRHLALLVVALALPAAAIAADAPTSDEWAPVVQAITAQAPDAGQRLSAITTRYPGWTGGWIELARYELATRRPEDARKHARQALTLEPTNGDAAALAVQALILVGRPDEALSVAAPFHANRQHDKQAGGRAGWVNFYAARAALSAKTPDLAAAGDLLTTAKACAGAAVPGEFHFLDAKLLIRRDDLVGAATCLERAVAVEPRLWDAWYELGRVRSALADRETSIPGQRQLLLAAEQAFASVTRALPDDFESWLGLGRAQAALAQVEIAVGGAGGAKLNDAAASFGEALQRQPDLVPALAALGEAQLRLERFAPAAATLSRAHDLGANDDILLSNLALALEKSGHPEATLRIQTATTASTAPALINKGMILFKAKVYRTAVERFEQAVSQPELENQRETRGQVLRFAGHAWRDWAAASATDPGTTSAAEREQRLESAADAYRRAGDLGDGIAIRHYAALQAERGPQSAYAAGWTLLGWTHFISFSGWKLVLGNYGASRAWANPLHLGIWGVLIGLPLLLWIAGLFRPRVLPAEEARRAANRRESDGAGRRQPTTRADPEMHPLTARVKSHQALEPRAAKPGAPARSPKTPRPGQPQAPRQLPTEPTPKRPPSARRTPLPETEEQRAPPTKRPRPR